MCKALETNLDTDAGKAKPTELVVDAGTVGGHAYLEKIIKIKNEILKIEKIQN